MRSLILRAIAQGVLPVTTLFALFLLVRGHDAPGGGFIAGLITSAAIVLQSLAFGFEATAHHLRAVVRPAAPVGLALAALTGLLGPLAGDALLTHSHWHVPLGAETSVHLSTTLIFDVGVYLAVVGAVTTALARFTQRGEP